MKHAHAVVWIDHHEAKVFHFNATETEETTVHSHDRHAHIHHKANTIGSGHALPDATYLRAVVDALADTGAILIVGPSGAKIQLESYIAEYDRAMLGRVAAVQPLDRATDGEVVAFARKFFRANDRMRQIA